MQNKRKEQPQGEEVMGVLERLEEKDVKRFDFIKSELDYIINNANFTEEQEKIFKMLTGKRGRETNIYIAMQMNISESTVKRRIKEIKNKIKRLL